MSEDEKLLHTLYYSPTTLYTSVNSLYIPVKQKGIKLKDVKEFIQKQVNTSQHNYLKDQKEFIHIFPLLLNINLNFFRLISWICLTYQRLTKIINTC